MTTISLIALGVVKSEWFISLQDFIQTRLHRINDKIHWIMWKLGYSKVTPPEELDFTALLDEADLQNKRMEAFKK